MYYIPSPISLVIFLVFDAEVWEIFQEKQGAAFNQQLLNLVVLLCFFWTTQVCWKVSYSQDLLIGEEIL